MTIGINAVAAFKQPRTGVEEYVYQMIKHLAALENSKKHRFILYSPFKDKFDFNLPNNFELLRLKWPIKGDWGLWTQLRLANEMLFNKPELLFIPVHVLPQIHPNNSIVTIHGLEYEYYPELYPKCFLRYIRWVTKYALNHAKKIITISESTKKDLIRWYGADWRKIHVIHLGFGKSIIQNDQLIKTSSYPYILFIGRIETKKNIHGLIKAFDLLKKKYQVPHKLVLVGSKGYGYKDIKFNDNIIEKGYVSEQEKLSLLKNAEMFVFPSFYEGFGMPILEAQAAGCPVITSDVSSMPEVAGHGAILIDPNNVEQIADMMHKVIDDNEFKKRLIQQGRQNIKRFSWRKCAQDTLKILTE